MSSFTATLSDKLSENEKSLAGIADEAIRAYMSEVLGVTDILTHEYQGEIEQEMQRSYWQKRKLQCFCITVFHVVRIVHKSKPVACLSFDGRRYVIKTLGGERYVYTMYSRDEVVQFLCQTVFGSD